MASPQWENGYTKIANELLEAVIRHGFNKRQLTVLLHVIRKTYGFNKKRDEMSLSQIANATGIGRPHVSVAVRELEAAKVLLIQDGRHAKSIAINKNYTDWKGYQNGNGVTETVRVTKTVTRGYQNGTKPVTKTVTTKENPKETTKRKGAHERAALSASDLEGRGVTEQHAKDWLAVRKAKRAPLTETAWLGLKREADKAGISPDEAVRICAERGWQSLKAEWLNAGRSEVDANDPMRGAL